MKTNHFTKMGAMQKSSGANSPGILPGSGKKQYLSYLKRLSIVPERMKKMRLFTSCINLLNKLQLENSFTMISHTVQKNWMLRPVAHCSFGALSS
jgi:hypothetical protein